MTSSTVDCATSTITGVCCRFRLKTNHMRAQWHLLRPPILIIDSPCFASSPR